MLDWGASIIDIGGESSRPGAEKVSIGEEISRVVPVIRQLRNRRSDAVISVDTYNSETARLALSEGADIVNDITGLSSEEMIRVISENNAAVIIMHMRGDPATMRRDDRLPRCGRRGFGVAG
jgi:dihydropteroate synthase